MSYKPRGMHLAANPELAPEAKPKARYTPRTLLPMGRPQFRRMLDSWDMVEPPKAVVMPGPQEDPLTPKVSRKSRVSPLTRIAQKLPAKLPVLTFYPKTRRRL